MEIPMQPQAQRLTIKTANSCLTVRAIPSGGDMQVWLGLDRDSSPEFIIGLGASAQNALGDAVDLLETIVKAMLERRHPEDWEFDNGEL
jgi:hypothetical protein